MANEQWHNYALRHNGLTVRGAHEVFRTCQQSKALSGSARVGRNAGQERPTRMIASRVTICMNTCVVPRGRASAPGSSRSCPKRRGRRRPHHGRSGRRPACEGEPREAPSARRRTESLPAMARRRPAYEGAHERASIGVRALLLGPLYRGKYNCFSRLPSCVDGITPSGIPAVPLPSGM